MDEQHQAHALPEAALPADLRRLHLALINSLLLTGKLPGTEVLAVESGVDLDVFDEHLQALAHGDYLAFDTSDQLTCLYPFSTVPTQHAVILDGERRFAMCSLDALGIAAMLGRPVCIVSSCPECGQEIKLAVQLGEIESAEPVDATVVAKHASDAPAVKTCCGYTVFACGPAHAGDLVARTPDTAALDLNTALAAGESLFGNLLAATLPAKRTRSRFSPTRNQR
jgi:alkylmercury lyase